MAKEPQMEIQVQQIILLLPKLWKTKKIEVRAEVQIYCESIVQGLRHSL